MSKNFYYMAPCVLKKLTNYCKIESNIKEIGIIFGVITSEIREFFKQEFNLMILTN